MQLHVMMMYLEHLASFQFHTQQQAAYRWYRHYLPPVLQPKTRHGRVEVPVEVRL